MCSEPQLLGVASFSRSAQQLLDSWAKIFGEQMVAGCVAVAGGSGLDSWNTDSCLHGVCVQLQSGVLDQRQTNGQTGRDVWVCIGKLLPVYDVDYNVSVC